MVIQIFEAGIVLFLLFVSEVTNMLFHSKKPLTTVVRRY